MRSSVCSFIQSIDGVGFIDYADNCITTRLLVEDTAPGVLIVDIDLAASTPGGQDCFLAWLAQLNEDFPALRTIALVNDHKQVDSMLQSGAVAAFLKGTLSLNLREAVTRLDKPIRVDRSAYAAAALF